MLIRFQMLLYAFICFLYACFTCFSCALKANVSQEEEDRGSLVYRLYLRKPVKNAHCHVKDLWEKTLSSVGLLDIGQHLGLVYTKLWAWKTRKKSFQITLPSDVIIALRVFSAWSDNMHQSRANSLPLPPNNNNKSYSALYLTASAEGKAGTKVHEKTYTPESYHTSTPLPLFHP